MKDIESWFSYEVRKWRSGASISWAILLIVPCTFMFVTVSDIDILHPLSFLGRVIGRFASASDWSCILMVMLVVGMVAWFNSYHYTVVPEVLCTRFGILWNTIKPRRVVQLASHALAAILVARSFLTMLGGRYHSLAVKCPESEDESLNYQDLYCMNEINLFITLHGAVIGVLYAAQFFLYHHNYITFPIVQQSKFFQVKSALFPMLMTSAALVFSSLKYYYVVYYLIVGSLFKRTVKKNMGLVEDPENDINSLRGLLDPSLFCVTLLTGTFVHYLFTLPSLLYKVYHTEPVIFPIETSFEDSKDKCLYNAMASSNPLVQYQGYQDLCMLAHYNPERRREIFSLTQLGGHPQNWNSLASECLTQIKALTIELAHFNAKTMADGPLHQFSGDMSKNTTASAVNSSRNSWLGPVGTPVDNLTFRRTHTSQDAPQSSTNTVKPQTLKHRIHEQIKKRKALVFFLAELPDRGSQKLFAESQKYIWAVQGLSDLVAASFREDTFGVVQKSLPDILSSLLALHEVVEKHFKLGANISRKPQKGPHLADCGSLRFSLKAAIKTSLYEIVTTFGEHVHSIALEPEELKKLQLLVEYKE